LDQGDRGAGSGESSHCLVAGFYVVADGVDSCGVVDPADLLDLARVDQREYGAGRSGAGGTPGAVQIVLVIVGRVVVHHQADVLDVDSPGGDVRSDQDAGMAGGERSQCALALVLVQVAVDSRRWHAGVAQLPGQPAGTVFSAGEKQRPAVPAGDLGRDR
jgi:hypothetical protein